MPQGIFQNGLIFGQQYRMLLLNVLSEILAFHMNIWKKIKRLQENITFIKKCFCCEKSRGMSTGRRAFITNHTVKLWLFSYIWALQQVTAWEYKCRKHQYITPSLSDLKVLLTTCTGDSYENSLFRNTYLSMHMLQWHFSWQ